MAESIDEARRLDRVPNLLAVIPQDTSMVGIPRVLALAYLIFGILISDLVGWRQGLKFVPLGVLLALAGAGPRSGRT